MSSIVEEQKIYFKLTQIGFMSLIKIKGIFRRNSGLKNSHILQKNQGEPKLFQICVNWNNRQKTVFKSNSV